MMGETAANIHTEAMLTAAILKTWPMRIRQPRYIVAVQVNNGAGFSYSRQPDAIVFDTWPSGGLQLHGIEIKCSKSDLRKELSDPTKVGGFIDHLDLFSIAAPPGIVDLDLLPGKWGLYCPMADGTLRARRKPLPLHDGGNQTAMDRSLAAAFVRALLDRSLSKVGLREEYERGLAEARSEAKATGAQKDHAITALKGTIEDFESKSGIKLSEWSAGRMGEVVSLMLRGGIEQRILYSGNLRDLANRLLKFADELDELSRRMSVPATGASE